MPAPFRRGVEEVRVQPDRRRGVVGALEELAELALGVVNRLHDGEADAGVNRQLPAGLPVVFHVPLRVGEAVFSGELLVELCVGVEVSRQRVAQV